MTPAARVQAAIELLDQIIDAAAHCGAAADTLAKRYFADRRYVGSKDRRAVRELVWRAIRHFAERPQNGRAAIVALADTDSDLAALFDGSPYGPALIEADEPRARAGGALPSALAPMLHESVLSDAEAAALIERAPVDVRVNRDRMPDDEQLTSEGVPLPPPLDGWRFPADTDVTSDPLYLTGAFEVQDAGSQMIAHICGVQPGMRALDLCAGAGGKSLALAAALRGQGALLACDTDRRRLGKLPQRAQRAGARIIEPRLINPGQERQMLSDWAASADIVLVDAPCSGTGTWRRNPEARWRVDANAIRRFAAEQLRLLHIGADLVVSGGALVYAVCALTRAEGADVVAQFLAERDGWRAEDLYTGGAMPVSVGRQVGGGVVLTPHHDATDGFFFARLRAA
jgi:16S rRNA (cytosine967-C5)-methyltransferase